jgi:ubiquinol-cytochrome c reductase iron-sulfur subunit
VKWIISTLVLLLGRGRRKPPLEPKPPPDRDAETLVLWLLLLVMLFAVAFAAFYVHDGDTQLLGLAIGLAFMCAAAASVLAALRLVPQDEHVESRPELDDQERAAEAIETYSEGSVRLTRKRLLLTAAVGAGGTLAGALVFPALSLGPNAVDVLSESPWREGRRVVDERGRLLHAAEIAVGSFRTAFPEHASKELLSSPIVVVRIEERELELPDDRKDWAPSGILAFSKICPHAGCAVSLFRYPSFEDTQPYAALICPCHYSTFKVADGGSRTFGPAARALPQLPLRIDDGGALVAGGDFSANVGPSWWKVRKDTGA